MFKEIKHEIFRIRNFFVWGKKGLFNPRIFCIFHSISGLASKVFSVVLAMLVIAVNIYFVVQYVIGLNITVWYFVLPISILGFLYLLFCLYLTIDMIINMGGERLATLPIVRKFFSPPDFDYTDLIVA